MCLKIITKYALFLFNLIFVIVGAVIIALGVFIHFKLPELREKILDKLDIYNVADGVKLDDFSALPIAIIIIGCAIFLIAFSGCCGAINESKCLLIIYACIMCILAAFKIYIVVTLLKNMVVYREKVETSVNNAFMDPQFNVTFHGIEHLLKCCGTHGADSYDGILDYLPPTCCEGVFETCEAEGATNLLNCLCENKNAYPDGCSTILGNYFDIFGKYTGYGFITVIVIEVLATVCAVYLITSIKKTHKV